MSAALALGLHAALCDALPAGPYVEIDVRARSAFVVPHLRGTPVAFSVVGDEVRAWRLQTTEPPRVVTVAEAVELTLAAAEAR